MSLLPPAAPCLALAAALVLLAACRDEAPAVAAGPSPDASNPTAMTDSIPASALRTDSTSADYDVPVTLVSMEPGDAACYLTVRPDGGAERTEYADFRMCERDDLIGQRVVLTATPSPVLAQSCQGNPDCTDTDMVNLVTGIDPADAAGAAGDL